MVIQAIRRTIGAWSLVLAAALVTPPPALATKHTSRPVATIPFTLNGKLVSLRVAVNGSRPLTFTLDSGASASVVDSSIATRVGLRAHGAKTIHGAGKGGVHVLLYRDVPLRAGSAAYRAPLAYGVSLKTVGTDQREAGLLGFDFFARYVIKVDYLKRTITLYRPDTYVYEGPGTAVPIQIVKHTPHLYATITVQGRPPMRRRLLVDSGSEDEVDDRVIALSTAKKQRISGGSGLGQKFGTYLGPIREVRIGPYALHDLRGVSGGVALVGSDVLRRFVVIYDYRHKTLIFEPPVNN